MSILFALLAAATPMMVSSVEADHRALVGRKILIMGWQTECQHLSCAICDQPPKILHDGAEEWVGNCLSIATSQSFDRAVYRRRAVHRQVLIEAEVGGCFADINEDDEIVICTDRASQLRRPRLVKILPEKAETKLTPRMVE